jgi:hypothetical protein
MQSPNNAIKGMKKRHHPNRIVSLNSVANAKCALNPYTKWLLMNHWNSFISVKNVEITPLLKMVKMDSVAK